MPIPRIAIVGRPNVGKSSLVNMLARAKVSIVDPTPGVTRDRVSAIVRLEPPDGRGPQKIVEVIDTGGFGAYVAEGERYDDVGADLATLATDIEAQIAEAVQTADLVLLAIDAQAGVTALDQEIARRLREGKLGRPRQHVLGESPKGSRRPPVRVIATKVDGPRWESHAMELAGLGFGEPLLVSAMNNYMRRDFVDQIYELLPEPEPEDTRRAAAELKLAIIGKRNAGKSTLVNALAGEPRMIVSEIAGTTRDAVDVRFEMDGRTLVAIDTAGLRRKRSFASQIEWYALDRLQLSVQRADVVLLLIDATQKISQVDEQVAMIAQKAFKPVIIVVNKWDLAAGMPGRDGRPVTPEHYEDYLRKELKGLWFAPISFMSGATGLNVHETIDLAFDLYCQTSERVTTGKLNRLIARILERQGPSDKLGSQAKVYFVAQTGTNPPTITLVVNKPELFSPNYQRFLLNRFREELPFSEVPIKLNIRARRRDGRDTDSHRPIAAAGVAAARFADATAEELFAEFDDVVDSSEHVASERAPAAEHHDDGDADDAGHHEPIGRGPRGLVEGIDDSELADLEAAAAKYLSDDDDADVAPVESPFAAHLEPTDDDEDDIDITETDEPMPAGPIGDDDFGPEPGTDMDDDVPAPGSPRRQKVKKPGARRRITTAPGLSPAGPKTAAPRSPKGAPAAKKKAASARAKRTSNPIPKGSARGVGKKTRSSKPAIKKAAGKPALKKPAPKNLAPKKSAPKKTGGKRR